MLHFSSESLAEWALGLAASHLPAVPRRWQHAQGAVRCAQRLAPVLGDDGDLLIAAAALHDIGFAPAAVSTGFSAVDGARWLEQQGAPRRLAALVAHVSSSAVEGALRGYEAEYAAGWIDECTPVRDALWCCCLTTGPDGEPIHLDDRVTEMRERYAGDPVIARYLEVAPPELYAAVRRAEALSQEGRGGCRTES